jgi:hypothetical protein
MGIIEDVFHLLAYDVDFKEQEFIGSDVESTQYFTNNEYIKYSLSPQQYAQMLPDKSTLQTLSPQNNSLTSLCCM